MEEEAVKLKPNMTETELTDYARSILRQHRDYVVDASTALAALDLLFLGTPEPNRALEHAELMRDIFLNGGRNKTVVLPNGLS